jgi:pimeloyl-ACP methyl ester carboxylesterase
MADYDEVRAALGYDKINLWGGSYGTRSAQEYLRRYPDRVRTVTLDGVASPSLILPENFARDARAALEAMFAACEKSPSCKANYPTLRADFDRMLADLRQSPRMTTIKNPLTGLSRETALTESGVTSAVFTSLYIPQLLAVLPETIAQANKGNFVPLYTLTGVFTDSLEETISFGMRLSVSCNEDVPRITPAMREQSKALAPFGDGFIESFTNGCEVWPRGKVKEDFFTPVKSDKPVLILSGGLDPVTPPVWGDEVKKTFSNSVHFVAPNIGHGVSHQGCAPQLIKQFIEKADVKGLDGKCLEKLPRPMFYQAMIENKKNEAAK